MTSSSPQNSIIGLADTAVVEAAFKVIELTHPDVYERMDDAIRSCMRKVNDAAKLSSGNFFLSDLMRASICLRTSHLDEAAVKLKSCLEKLDVLDLNPFEYGIFISIIGFWIEDLNKKGGSITFNRRYRGTIQPNRLPQQLWEWMAAGEPRIRTLPNAP